MSSILDLLSEAEAKVFPSDDKIKDVIKVADAAFWKVILEAFKDFVETKDISSEISGNFGKEELNYVKEWLMNNQPKETKSDKVVEPKKEFSGVKETEPMTKGTTAGDASGQAVRY